MITMTNEEVVSAYQALHAIGERHGCDPVASLKAARNKKILLPLVETRDDSIQKILKEYVQKDGEEIKRDDDGNVIFLNDNARKQWLDAFKKISVADVEVEILFFTEDELEHLQATPNEMYALLPLLTK